MCRYLARSLCLFRYLVGARAVQPEMMWWMVSLDDRQIRQESSLVEWWICFLIYLVVIDCSWMAQMVDSVDRLRVDDLSHRFDLVESMWGCCSCLKCWPCSGFCRREFVMDSMYCFLMVCLSCSFESVCVC